MDTVSSQRRSEIMGRIRGRDTKPELIVRRFLHRAGLRYRLHRRGLPGRPDLVFPSRKLCVFVHGCFWHGCPRCVDGRRAVKSNTTYWSSKVEGNRARDVQNRERLEHDGWKVVTFWECDTTRTEALEGLLTEIMQTPLVR